MKAISSRWLSPARAICDSAGKTEKPENRNQTHHHKGNHAAPLAISQPQSRVLRHESCQRQLPRKSLNYKALRFRQIGEICLLADICRFPLTRKGEKTCTSKLSAAGLLARV